MNNKIRLLAVFIVILLALMAHQNNAIIEKLNNCCKCEQEAKHLRKPNKHL